MYADNSIVHASLNLWMTMPFQSLPQELREFVDRLELELSQWEDGWERRHSIKYRPPLEVSEG